MKRRERTIQQLYHAARNATRNHHTHDPLPSIDHGSKLASTFQYSQSKLESLITPLGLRQASHTLHETAVLARFSIAGLNPPKGRLSWGPGSPPLRHRDGFTLSIISTIVIAKEWIVVVTRKAPPWSRRRVRSISGGPIRRGRRRTAV